MTSEAQGRASRIRSARARGAQGAGCLIAFGVVFGGLGLLFVFVGWVWPQWQGRRTLSWTPTPCEIFESRVETSDGSSFFHVRYAYEAGGLKRESTSFRAGVRMGRSSSAAHDLVQRYPPGSRQTCHVDPRDPSASVLEPGPHGSLAFLLIPGLFTMIGAGIVYAGLRLRASRHELLTRSDELGAADFVPARRGKRGVVPGEDDWLEDSDDGRELQLEVRQGPLAKFAVLLFVAAFWNGIVGVFVYQLAVGGMGGGFGWFAWLFLTPFLLIGLFLIGALGAAFLLLFAPRFELRLRPGALRPGETGYVSWRVRGSARRVAHLEVRLVGQERVRWRHGTDVSTKEQAFHEALVFETGSRGRIEEGDAEVPVPARAMHTFRGESNQVEWSLCVKADLPRWPDVEETFVFDLLPARTEAPRG